MRRHLRTKAIVLIVVVVALAGPARFPAGAAQTGAAAGASTGGFLILLSNDDGYGAPGLVALTEALRPLGEIYVAAPATEQSGKGHAITTTREPIFVSERKQPNGVTWYAIEGTPASCVRLAVESLLPRRPDLVISGINRGDNVGIAVFLSGTVGAAREGAVVGVPAIAASLNWTGSNEKDFTATAAFVRELVEELRARQLLKPGFFLNVNHPAGQPKGVRWARLSTKPTHENYDRRTSPRGRLYFWSQYRPLEDDEEGTDVHAFVRGYITLTPMTLDTTDRPAMDKLRALELRVAAPAVR